VQLPRQPTPSWFIHKIQLSLSTPIAILDDDVSVHRAWQLKLADISKDLALNFFTEPRVFLDWAEQQTDFVLLTDYKLNNILNGLDIIERLSLKKKAILSTGQYDQHEVINRCQQLGCYLLPKNLMYYVSVSIYG
jgi:FixJ family two-component response regulator